MNIEGVHSRSKAVSAVPIFKGTGENTIALQILADQELKEHITKVPALLISINAEVLFENEKGFKETLFPGDYVPIEPMVKHWVRGIADFSWFLLSSIFIYKTIMGCQKY